MQAQEKRSCCSYKCKWAKALERTYSMQALCSNLLTGQPALGCWGGKKCQHARQMPVLGAQAVGSHIAGKTKPKMDQPHANSPRLVPLAAATIRSATGRSHKKGCSKTNRDMMAKLNRLPWTNRHHSIPAHHPLVRGPHIQHTT
jgi:hypothetical protein